MKPIRHIVLIVLLAALTSCEEMFVREIDFTAEAEPEMLVLSSNNVVGLSPAVVLYHTFFFGHSRGKSKGEVSDAEVSVRLNHGEWIRLHTKTKGQSAMYNWVTDSTVGPRLNALDTVEYVITHPLYATITAQQVMPARAEAKVVKWELMPNYWLDITIEFEPYYGNADDVIGIRHDGGTLKATTGKQTRNLAIKNIYSNDVVFAEAQNLEAQGYYGAPMSYYLFFPSSILKNKKQIHIIADCGLSSKAMSQYESVSFESITLGIGSCTYETYLYEQFVRQYKRMQLSAPSGFAEGEDNIMAEILEGISEMLGDQEPVQVYTNIQGGLGHLSGYCSYGIKVKP